MTSERTTSFEADPAGPEPSEVRPGCCAHCGRGPVQDPVVDPDLRMLGWLAEMGMQLTEVKLSRARRLLESDDPKDGAADRSDLEFYRLSRAIRMTIVLKNNLRNERAGQAEDAAAKQEADRQDRKQRPKQAVEKQTQHDAERLKEAEADEHAVTDRRDALFETLSERLEEDDFERDLARCSTGELVKRICRDLGSEAAWELWRNSRWAREEAAGAKPAGSPCETPPAPEAAEPGPVAAGSEDLEPAGSESEAPATATLLPQDYGPWNTG